MKYKYIYIACPMTIGDQFINTRRGIETFMMLLDRGFVPYCPTLSNFAHLLFPRDYEVWMKHCFAVIDRHDAILAIDMEKESAGRGREIKYARETEKPVFYTVEEIENANERAAMYTVPGIGSALFFRGVMGLDFSHRLPRITDIVHDFTPKELPIHHPAGEEACTESDPTPGRKARISPSYEGVCIEFQPGEKDQVPNHLHILHPKGDSGCGLAVSNG